MRGKPVQIIAVETDPNLLRIDTGRVYHEANVTLGVEDVERLKHGYVCIRCFEVQDEAFPQECSLCHFPMREEQRKHFEAEFQGDKHVGPQKALDEHIDELDAKAEERQWREVKGK